MISDYALLAIIVVEIIIVFCLLIALLIRRFADYIQEGCHATQKKHLIACLMHSIEYGMISDALTLYPACHNHTLLLSVLEDFDKRLKGTEWDDLKATLAKLYLLPKARQRARSTRWLKRLFAVRCFALDPLKEDEEILLELLDDPAFLVRNIAATCLVKAESYQGVVEVITRMSVNSGYRRYIYRDILLMGSLQVFAWIIRIAITDKQQDIHLATLEVLSGKVIMDPLNFLKEDLKSINPEIRKLAIRTYATNPHQATVDIFLKHANDLREEIQLEAIEGLSHFFEEQVFQTLRQLIDHRAWKVRLAAARVLKKMGPQGVDLLRDCELNGSEASQQLARYALQFD